MYKAETNILYIMLLILVFQIIKIGQLDKFQKELIPLLFFQNC